MDRLRQPVQVTHMAEHVRLLDDARGVFVDEIARTLLPQPIAGQFEATGHQVDVARRHVGLHHLAPLRVDAACQNDPLAAGEPLSHEHGLADGRGAIVDRVVGHFEPEQIAHQRLELERHLQRALAHLWLVRRVRRVELRLAHDVADRGRRVVVVGAAADEAWPITHGHVLCGELSHVSARLELRERRRQIERWVPRIERDVGEELVDALDPDRAEHMGAVVGGELGEIRHLSEWSVGQSSVIRRFAPCTAQR